jgi:hypothetical protein
VPPGRVLAVFEDSEQLRRRREAPARILHQQCVDDLLEERGELRVDLAETTRVLVADAAQYLVERPAAIRVRAGRELVEQYAERVEVRAPVHVAALELLRRGVLDRPDECAALAELHRLVR